MNDSTTIQLCAMMLGIILAERSFENGSKVLGLIWTLSAIGWLASAALNAVSDLP